MLCGVAGTASEMTAFSAVLAAIMSRKPRFRFSQCLGLFKLWFLNSCNQTGRLGKNKPIQQSCRSSLWIPVSPSRIDMKFRLGSCLYLQIQLERAAVGVHLDVQERTKDFNLVCGLHKQLKP